MYIKKLSTIPFEKIVDCFLASFKGYFVAFPSNYNYYKERWSVANVNYDLSYGMFDEDLLVGFIINGIDTRGKEFIAYNSGTGVLPDYRGQKIIKQLYTYGLEELSNNGITKCTLEVIKENHIAIKAYEGIGFKIVKDFKCFKGFQKEEITQHFDLKEVLYSDMVWNSLPNQSHYSWDYHPNTIMKGNNAYYFVQKNGVNQSYFVAGKSNDYILQWDCLIDTEENWKDLMTAIFSFKKMVKINNVDEILTNKIYQLKKAGFECTVEQYEMEMDITKQ